jgi:hypothetical protein
VRVDLEPDVLFSEAELVEDLGGRRRNRVGPMARDRAARTERRRQPMARLLITVDSLCVRCTAQCGHASDAASAAATSCPV